MKRFIPRACRAFVVVVLFGSQALAQEELSWAFQPLASPAAPPVKDKGWTRDDLDRFILARLEKEGLTPNGDADRRTLIRRAAYDLTGLPPTPKEIATFLADPAGDDEAFARVVDRYLESPRFGERWGRHWLDVARYSDCTGQVWNAPLTYAWRYRDYVIDAFNKDKPFDRFIAEQVAGDLLPASTIAEERENRIATGFLALGSVNLQAMSHEQFVLDTVDDQIDVVTRGFLGISVSCARCHDHKYDPVTMHDYYALAGIFYSTRTMPGVAHQREFGGEGYVNPSKLLVLPALDGTRGKTPASGEVHSMSDYQDVWRTGERKIRFTTHPNYAMGVFADEPRDCEIRIKGEPYDYGETPPRGDLQIPGLTSITVPASACGRLELAQWLTSDEQPLTPRVMANRIWQHLFGLGIVRTVDDFGVNAEPPTHPELLDHLAIRFREEGWSVKKLIRSIMLSRTYRLSSEAQPAGTEQDPQNLLHWRMSRRRLELEPLRDSLLTVAGSLSLERPHGIQVSGIGGKSRQSQVASLLPFDSTYRTVYLPVLRGHLPEECALFDFPEPSLLQGQREITTVAPQALFFMNGPFVIRCSRQAAEELLAQVDSDDAKRVAWAYERVLSRPPAPDELKDALELIRGLEADGDDPELARWATVIQALMLSAEFRYIR